MSLKLIKCSRSYPSQGFINSKDWETAERHQPGSQEDSDQPSCVEKAQINWAAERALWAVKLPVNYAVSFCGFQLPWDVTPGRWSLSAAAAFESSLLLQLAPHPCPSSNPNKNRWSHAHSLGWYPYFGLPLRGTDISSHHPKNKVT